MKCIKIIVSGRVQGVYFRACLMKEAQRLGLVGYTMNQTDGTVLAIAQGSAEQLKALELWCGQGPPLAEVQNVQTTAMGELSHFNGFEIRR